MVNFYENRQYLEKYSNIRLPSGYLLPPLCAAIRENDNHSIILFLESGANPNCIDGWYHRNALHWVGLRGCNERALYMILEKISNVNSPDWYGFTPLMYCAKKNKLNVMISLMNFPNININYQSVINNEWTALHQAVYSNNYQIVEQILRYININLNLKDKWNRTPLKVTIKKGFVECEKILRDNNAIE